MTQQTGRPGLHAAIGARIDAQRREAEDAAAPQCEAQQRQAKADAALYGAAGWDAIGSRRQQRAAAYAASQTEEGSNDAA